MHGAVALSAALLVGLALSTACGPSVQSIHEGNVRFEHCYRLDLEPEVASSHRRACWTNWMDRYTYGQSRDRLEYANRRVVAFNGGDTAPPQLQIGEHQEESRQFYLVVPGPTSVHAPPAPIATRVNAPAPPPTASASTAPAASSLAPGESCAIACKNAFASCSDVCGGEAASTACKSCDPDYKKCMQRCFE